MHPVIIIPARRGATRLPDKPLADIHGQPMIAHVCRRALESGVGPVWVATDDAEIAAAAEACGVRAVMTAAAHPSGSDRIREALHRIDPQGAYDTIINLQGDLPTLDPRLVQDVLLPLRDTPAVDIATLVCEIADAAERADPAVVKPVVAWQDERCQRGRALYFTRCSAPHGEGPLYHHIGIYAYRRAALERFVALPPSPLERREKLEQLRALEHHMRIDVVRVDTVPLGVDTYEHLEKARKIISH